MLRVPQLLLCEGQMTRHSATLQLYTISKPKLFKPVYNFTGPFMHTSLHILEYLSGLRSMHTLVWQSFRKDAGVS